VKVNCINLYFYLGHTVVLLVDSVRYTPEDRGFDFRWGLQNFSLTEYQEYFLGTKDGRCIGLTTVPPSHANCFEVWDP
jgi:hypothetical protein